MTLEWDGVPQNPKETGWHWIKTPNGSDPVPCYWKVTNGNKPTWRHAFQTGTFSASVVITKGWQYIGPCLVGGT